MTYLQRLRSFNRDTRLLLIIWALVGLAYFGVFVLLLNLYLLRLGYDVAFIGQIDHGAQVLCSALVGGATAKPDAYTDQSLFRRTADARGVAYAHTHRSAADGDQTASGADQGGHLAASAIADACASGAVPQSGRLYSLPRQWDAGLGKCRDSRHGGDRALPVLQNRVRHGRKAIILEQHW